MMKNDNKRKMFGLGLFIFIVGLLVIFAIYLALAIVDNTYSNKLEKVNKETVSYISFLFENNAGHMIEVKSPKIVSDDIGRLLFDDSFYSFYISIDEDLVDDEDLEYIVTAEAIGKTINEDYIKFYLTDEEGNILGDYDGAVSFSNFEEEKDISGKVIYRGKFNKESTEQTLNIRVWVSDEYELDEVAGFSYQLNVLVNS